MVEFGKSLKVIMTRNDDSYSILTLEELLPKSFGRADMVNT